ncbi:MAG: DNRLRE domain-containing protein [Verrucomicrobiota bacterium]
MKIPPAVLITITPIATFAASMQFTPSQDASIMANDTSVGNGSLFGGYNASGQERRPLVQFDVSAIPASAAVDSVSLSFDANLLQGSQTFTLHAVNTPWVAGTNTGNGGGGGQGSTPTPVGSVSWETPWTTSGGDFGSALDSVLVDSAGTVSFSDPLLLALVQTWVGTPAANNGFILVGTNTNAQNAIRFGSSETGVAPVLDVTYTAIPEPKLFALAAGFAAIGLAIIRRK